MARTVKPEENLARRNEILDCAQRLVYTKGFDRMTIRDILEDLHISKGAFYHYFSSKTDVLEALIERMVDIQIQPMLEAIVGNPQLSGLEKLHAYFDTAARWKSGQKELMLSLLQVWYSDENALFREKMFAFSMKRISPMLGEIIHQGIDEGVFNTAHPDYLSQVIFHIIQALSTDVVELLLEADKIPQDDPGLIHTITEVSDAADDAIQRILGAPEGSIHVIKPDMLKTWFETEGVTV